MKTLFNNQVLAEVEERLSMLNDKNERLWGTMDPAQMLAHCSKTFEMAMGKQKSKRLLIGYLLGPFFKKGYLGEKPFGKNSPTDKKFIITGNRNFSAEMQNLKEMLREFSLGGEYACTRKPHSFFGKLSPAEWGVGMYKHMDHHLRQFGV